MWLKPEETPDLVTLIKEILNGKVLFLCSALEPQILINFLGSN